MLNSVNDIFPRRSFLAHASAGVAGMAAAGLWFRDGTLTAASPDSPGLHHPAKARHVIHIFLGGGLSQVDSFDYKPELERFHDQEMPVEFGKADPFMGKAGRLHQSHYPFKQRGESGLWMSDLFPQLNEVADELTVIRSMVAETANHIPGVRSIPNSAGGAFNWSSGFLPAKHQGVPFNTKDGPPIRDLQPASELDSETQHERLEALAQLNQLHLEQRVHTDLLSARIHSYELAARMQAAIPEAMDLSSEPQHIQSLWTGST